MNNNRGIFSDTVARGLVDKILYKECYDIIDGNISDSDVGGRQKRSIKDNLFIVYGIFVLIVPPSQPHVSELFAL